MAVQAQLSSSGVGEPGQQHVAAVLFNSTVSGGWGPTW